MSVTPVSAYAHLFSPVKVGSYNLFSRVAMNPMTRNRCEGKTGVQSPLAVQYYGDRAGVNGAALLITEGVTPSPDGLGYARMPGLWNAAQINSWKGVTAAVKAKGSVIFLQMMHCGRIATQENLPEGGVIKGPSPFAAKGTMYTDAKGNQEHAVPKEMTTDDIKKVIEEFTTSADKAVNEAGFDGIELHSANGYLLDQFLQASVNKRTDSYGGSAENRNRFVLELAKSVADKIGAGKLGIRVSPYGVFNDVQPFEGIEEQYISLASELKKLGLAYLHIVDHSSMGAPPVAAEFKAKLKAAFGSTVIHGGGYGTATPTQADKDIADGKVDIIGIGRALLANPDYSLRVRKGAELNAPDMSTFYTPGDKGYNTYAKLA